MFCKQKLLFWMRLIAINRLTALIFLHYGNENNVTVQTFVMAPKIYLIFFKQNILFIILFVSFDFGVKCDRGML